MTPPPKPIFDPLERVRHPIVEMLSNPGNENAWLSGIAQIGDEQVSQYIFVVSNYDVSGGSIDSASAALIINAIETAISRRMPFVAYVNSGGMNVEEHAASLVYMPQMQHAISRHRNAHLPSVGVFGMNTIGGALVVFGELQFCISRETSSMGLSGIRTYHARTGEFPPRGELSGQAQYEQGQLDLCITETGEVAASQERQYIELFLGLSRLQAHPPDISTHLKLPEGVTEQNATPTQRYESLIRADHASGSDYALHTFDSYLPLRQHQVVKTGIAHSAGVDLMVISHDRSANDGRLTARDMKVALRALRTARERMLRILNLVDCVGGDPDLTNEYSGFTELVAQFGSELLSHPMPTASAVVGELGSGIGVQFTATDFVYALEGAAMFALEPAAYKAIKHEDRMTNDAAIARMWKPLTFYQRIGVVDEIIPREYESVKIAMSDWVLQGHSRDPGILRRRFSRPAKVADRFREEPLEVREIGIDALGLPPKWC